MKASASRHSAAPAGSCGLQARLSRASASAGAELSMESTRGAPASGDTVAIRSADGRWLARAAWSPESQIRARVWSFDETETVDAAFFDRRVLVVALLARIELPD